ncbi:MAG: bifunctional (p)ppGpp synthetase/guanosine-3',5'-bis(diphosphate) 3'-pyrophosphohydrolase, partial [Pseudomonadota bacterium]|nr:bifunctional (p)ppGpp synthetase/guanosine-3',5'-bis(diphosphate) 3'-pyrophosphohydrolase [Pseudomonadota bacterium]
MLISDLLGKLETYLDHEATADVYRAYLFGAEAHEDQTRRSGEPYIYHPIAVASILADMRMDSRTIMGAILHDVIEDTTISRDRLAGEFGEDVAHLVDGVSKISQLEENQKLNAEAESLRKMLMAMAQDIRVILIKLADRLHNMRTLGSLKPEKRRRISRQTMDIFAPIADRLGMRDLTLQLEDLSFRNLYPKRYAAIEKELVKQKRGRKPVIDKLCKNLRTHLKQMGIKATVTGREKNIFSIYRKMQSKRLSMEQLQDIFGVRVIVDTEDDCYRTLGIIHHLYKPRPANFKDYIAIPKVNGYQSLHTVVFGPFGQTVEVQIRTRNMHRVADSGVASHWLYKTDAEEERAPQQLAQKWLSSFLDTQDEVGDSAEFLEYLKADLFPDKVYVFTPRGDITRLPRGATALDFAYAVHSYVGNHCVGAQVNQRMVPLHAVLRNGNHVEILTSASARPLPSWLNYVVTSKARSSIRGFLKHQQGQEALELGRELLDKSLQDFGYSHERIPTDDKIDLLEQLRLEDWTVLLQDIGFGRRLPNMVAQQLLAKERPEDAQDGKQTPLMIRGSERLLVNYAKCCYPIPGDRIIGFLTTGRGLVVHTADCPNTHEFRKQPDKWLHIDWAEDIQGSFEVKIVVESRNRPGVLGRLASIIAEQKSNINSVSMDEQDRYHSTIHFVIEAENRKHLADIMRTLHTDNSV